jgi:LysM repeat protein
MRTRRQPLFLSTAVVVAVTAGALLSGSAAATDRVITVQAGDTLSGIAARHGLTVRDLVALNGIADPNRIYAGQRLKLATAPAQPSAAPAQPGSAAAQPRTHRVAFGENLTWIARRYGTSIAAIVSANGLANPSYIRTGQVLTIPAAGGNAAVGGNAAAPAPSAPATSTPAAPKTPPAAQSRTHRVASGENLTWIARRYGTSIAAIVSANGLANPSYIRTGQVLTIPGAAVEGSAAPAQPATASAATGSGMPASMATLVARRQGVRDLIVAEAARQGVPAAFALAVAWQESGWQQGVVSSAGAIGIMQLLPATGEWVGQVMLGQPVNLHDPASNVRAGVRLLRHYLDRYGDRSLALAAYYQGQTAADRHGIYPVSRPYIASILRLEEIFAR